MAGEDYIISFSLKEDNLILWAEFSEGIGYSIGFRGKELLSMLN